MTRYAAAEHAFTVDPVDGTKNFVNGSPDHAVMVGETRDGEASGRGSGSRSTSRRTSPNAAPAPRQRRAPSRRRTPPTRRAGAASPRGGRGSAAGWATCAPLELTWVCCGVDYPKLVEGGADFILYGRPGPGTTCRARCC